MEIVYTIVYAEDVIQKNIPALPKVMKKRIQDAIATKLVYAPETFGKPLRRSLKGYRSLRVGEYCVIFSIDAGKQRVSVVLIAHRSVAYNLL